MKALAEVKPNGHIDGPLPEDELEGVLRGRRNNLRVRAEKLLLEINREDLFISSVAVTEFMTGILQPVREQVEKMLRELYFYLTPTFEEATCRNIFFAFDIRDQNGYNGLKGYSGGGVVVQVSLAEAKKVFSSLVNRVVYGKERVILLSRGKPKAAIVSIEDLKTLESLEAGGSRLRALEEAHRLRRELASFALKPTTAELDAIRGERTDEFDRMR